MTEMGTSTIYFPIHRGLGNICYAVTICSELTVTFTPPPESWTNYTNTKSRPLRETCADGLHLFPGRQNAMVSNTCFRKRDPRTASHRNISELQRPMKSKAPEYAVAQLDTLPSVIQPQPFLAAERRTMRLRVEVLAWEARRSQRKYRSKPQCRQARLTIKRSRLCLVFAA